jgi:PAS domain S-box-containing protein
VMRKSLAWASALLILIGLYAASCYNYLLFHCIAEVFSVVVACGIFMVAWNTRRYRIPNYLLLIGIAYLFIGVLDFTHTLAYAGMNIFNDYGANAPTQLWIAARYMESLTLLAAPFMLHRRTRPGFYFLIYAAVTAAVIVVIFHWRIFPDCYRPDAGGLTPFKKISEYIICLILLAAGFLAYRRRAHFDPEALKWLLLSIAAMVFSELAFTTYASVFGFANLLGHYFKIISFYLIYKAVIETGLTKPYDLLFRDLERQSEAHSRQRRFLETLLDTAQVCIAVMTGRDLRYTVVNKAYQSLRPNVPMLGRTYRDVFPEAAAAGTEALLQRVLDAGEPRFDYGYHAPIPGKPDAAWDHQIVRLPSAQEEESSVLVITWDVTDHERMEEALRQSEERLRLLGNNLPDSAVYQYTHGADGKVRFLYCSAGIERLNGVRAEEVLRDPNILHGQIPPEHYKPFVEAEARSARELSDFDMDVPMRRPDGKIRWMRLHSRPRRTPDGGVVWDGVQTDVTERKRTEEALMESEQRVRRKLKSVLTPEGDLGALELADLIDTQALQELMNNFYALARIPMSILDIQGNVLVRVGWQEICTRFHRVHPDTRRHCLDSAARLSAGLAQDEYRLSKCRNNMWDMATPIIVAGRHVGDIHTGQFFFEDEEVDRALFRTQAREYSFDEEQYLTALDRVPRLSRKTVDRGMAFLLKLADTLSQLGYSNARLARLLAERDRLADSLREREERLKASLGEKEVLLQEIHHRVKNNMQVISSLVSLQAEESPDAAMRAVLMDVAHRVRSMALVHEKLYQSIDLARVEFDEYARSLLSYLWHAHGAMEPGTRLTMDLAPVSLPVNMAVPCGLILNELFSNALKHAFGNGAGGEIAVSLSGGMQGPVRMVVRDNGSGLPEGFDWREARSLGLRLVHMLAGQLHAAVEVANNGGTEFAITFKGMVE